MTFEEFVIKKNVNIKNSGHEKIIKMFYPYLQSVSGDSTLLPKFIGEIIGVYTNDLTVSTGCFNGCNDNSITPFEDVDFYVRFSNNIKVFVYHEIKVGKVLKTDEYVICVINNNLENIERKNNYIYLR